MLKCFGVLATVAGLLAVMMVAFVPSALAGTLGGEPPDFSFGSNEPDFTAVAGVNTVTGTLGPTPDDGQDLFEVIIPDTLEVTSVSYSGPGGPHNLVGCGLTGVDILNQTFSPPQSGCTLSYFINTNFAESSSPWTVTLNVQVKPIVEDTTAPVVTPPANQTVEATSAAGAVVTYPNATATDDVGVTSGPICTPASGSTFALGTTTVTCTAEDAAGNVGSASFTVMVVDTTAPALVLPADITTEATGPAGAVVIFDLPAATDLVDPAPEVVCDALAGAVFPLGTTTVNCSATDDAGNIGNGSFDVTVVDTTAPLLTVPANITIEATSPAGVIVTFDATATDVVDVTPTVVCNPPSGSLFPFGTTTVDCSATDDAGNVSNSSFDVIVVDTTAPALIVPDDMVLNADSPGGVAVPYNVTASDVGDDQPVVVCQPPSGSVFPVGSTVVTCTATDSSGNQVTGSFVVTVAGVYEQMDDVMASVWDSNLSFWSKYRLSITLARAKLALAFGQTSQACVQFNSFISQVQAQSGSGLTPAQAGELIADATRIKAVIGCNG